MPDRDPADWFIPFFEVHSARFPGMPWPDLDSPAFATLVEAWVHHFRVRKVSQHRANAASLALMLIKHYPSDHLAEFFAAMPEPSLDYYRPDPRGPGYWVSGPRIWPEPRKGGGGRE